MNSFMKKISKSIDLFNPFMFLKYIFKYNKIDFNKTIKVLILNNNFATLGGGEKHMGYLCNFLETYYMNLEIDLIIFTEKKFSDDQRNKFDIKNLINKFNIVLNKTKVIYFENTIQKKIRKISKKYDIFINFTFMNKFIPDSNYCIYQNMFPPKKYYKNDVFNKFAESYINILFKKSYDFFVSNSKFSYKWMSRIWGKSKKNCVIYPPVFYENEIKQNYIEKNKRNIILSVGRFFIKGHSKKQDILINFFINNYNNIFKNWELHLAGSITGNEDDLNYLGGLKKNAEGYPIFFHINSDYKNIIKLYKKAKIFWHATGYNEDDNPEKMEHFGITTVEAMSFGAVPIVINKGGQIEIINDTINGFLWNNENECITATKQIIDDDKYRKKIAYAANKKALFYSIEKFFERNKKIFSKLR